MASQKYKQAPYFEIRYGSANFSTGTTKINAWVLVNDVRTFPSRALSKTRKSANETADREGFGDYGHWHTDYLEYKPGTILLITAETTRRKVPLAGAGLLVRLREGAPMYQVTVNVTVDPLCRYERLPVFVGRGDIVEYDQVNEEYGVELLRGFVSNWLEDEDEFNEVFTVDTLANARSGAPEIIQVDGEDGVETVTVDPAPRRRTHIRRKD